MDYEIGETYRLYAAGPYTTGGMPIAIDLIYVGVTPTNLQHVFNTPNGITPQILGATVWTKPEDAMQWSKDQAEAYTLANLWVCNTLMPQTQEKYIDQPWEHSRGLGHGY